MGEFLQVGAVTNTHGLKGEVKVFPTTDDAKRFEKLKKVLLDTGKEQIELTITQVKFQKKLVILKFKDYDNINDVEKWKGMPLYVSREHAVKCEKDEYFIADLIGLKVIAEDGEILGEIKDVLKTGANDVYVITAAQGSDFMIPAIKECILNINLEEQRVKVHVMAGLRD